jgi:hypothetical protein
MHARVFACQLQAAMTATLDGFTRLARCISSATAAAHSGAQAPPQQCSTGAGSSSDEEASLRQVLHLWSGLVMAAAEQHSSDAQALEAARTQLEQQAAHILGLESAAAARAQDGVEADAQD